MDVSALGVLLLGVVLGYLIGHPRGVLRLPLIPRSARRSIYRPATSGTSAPALSGPSETDAGAASIDTPENRERIKADLANQYPELLAAQVDSAVDEIVKVGRQMFPGRV